MTHMMKRDRQIQLMKDSEERASKRVTKLLRVPIIRESISRDNPKRAERPDFVEESGKLRKCG